MRTEHKVVRQEVHWVPEAVPALRKVYIGDEMPYRVWTVYTHDQEDTPPTLPMVPQHHQGFFLEDYLHDWDVRKDDAGIYLKYGSRVADGGIWILVEYVAPGECPWDKMGQKKRSAK